MHSAITKLYKLRAECIADVIAFINLSVTDIVVRFIITTETEPDVELEFLAKADIEEIKDWLKKVHDGHVMVETINEKDKYTGLRSDLGMTESAYWKKRCLLVENILEHTPCDPDINDEQITAHNSLRAFLKEFGNLKY